MIVRINRDRVDADGREKRTIGGDSPRGGTAATVGRFPYSASNGTEIRNDGAVDCRSWIDRDSVYAALGSCVIVTTRAAGHLQRRRAKCGKATRTQSQGRHRLRYTRGSSCFEWNASWNCPLH